MFIKIKTPRVFIGAILLLTGWAGLSAQFSNTYYHMFGVPQANQLNPAFQPNCNAYLGLPTLGPVRLDVELPAAYNEIFTFNSSLEQYITFLHPQGDKQAFLDALEPINTFRLELGSPVLSTGWRKENFFYTIDFTERADFGLTVPKDLAEFLVNGTITQDRFSFSGLGVDMNFFHELAVGVSYNNDDEFQIGVRAKLLLGLANVKNVETDINLRTEIDEWKIKSNIQYNITLPYLDNLPRDSDGNLLVDSLANMDIEDIFSFPDDPMNFLNTPAGIKTALGMRNLGFALDFGFNYYPIEQLSVSASVVDLGFIRWRNEAYQFNQSMDYTFEGLEFPLDDDTDIGQELLDSIKDNVQITAKNKPYTNMLTGKIYYGAAYELTEKVRFGFVGRTRVYNYNFYNQYTISANVMPISMFSASVSYSIYSGHFHNLGLGLSLRLGPLNMYFITDQAPSVYLIPESINSLNFRLGLNLAVGCRKESKKMKDRPLIE